MAIRASSPRAGNQILDQLDRLGACVLLPDDSAFPPLLSEVPDPPALLFAWGDPALLARPAAGIVGSPDHSPYGAEAARLLAAGLAGAGALFLTPMPPRPHPIPPTPPPPPHA